MSQGQRLESVLKVALLIDIDIRLDKVASSTCSGHITCRNENSNEILMDKVDGGCVEPLTGVSSGSLGG